MESLENPFISIIVETEKLPIRILDHVESGFRRGRIIK